MAPLPPTKNKNKIQKPADLRAMKGVLEVAGKKIIPFPHDFKIGEFANLSFFNRFFGDFSKFLKPPKIN